MALDKRMGVMGVMGVMGTMGVMKSSSEVPSFP
jgi:hypothetical protein